MRALVTENKGTKETDIHGRAYGFVGKTLLREEITKDRSAFRVNDTLRSKDGDYPMRFVLVGANLLSGRRKDGGHWAGKLNESLGRRERYMRLV
jgi:hypothetical protein